MTHRVEAILLAAGRSSRMKGGDKTLELINGKPLLRHLATEALASKAAETHVVLPPDTPERHAALAGLTLNTIIAEQAHLGMSASLKAGLSVADQADAILVMLADMPEITSDHINALITAFQPSGGKTIIQASSADGTPGHPVLFAQTHFEALAGLKGDQGARDILKTHEDQITRIPLSGASALTDLDTPDDWARWRASQQ